ncbi:flavin-containing monooxygenase [Mycolicibacterium celeriflavum]|uniref:Putative monooxygenase n=1 Tax=Mycolicibacterium celeriflavum TaxID=1249101 RepID=A0A1X0C154_MYCCF|nr:NAD(P)/FAD-dependent oxidoreductase [Mycolicibacterium celeriflavum]MCV7238327.1 NAD(P)/FAD-dependent oxidoreductase [Mycolicibacterium celeriflavum]ORA50992.1 4-hydroxyacetophenone monooxygenase [Mycolicibacterium celeriflavum]BBY44866.1 putative monooxygenase [Mycolicibacterium celeriflavum]
MTASVVIIGAGFAGLGAAIRLRQSGFDDFVILERASAVGGTWRDNTYPGAACDIPSLLYSYSFAQKPDWPHGYSGSDDILSYIEWMVEKFDLHRFIRFDTEVTGLSFDESAGVWSIATAAGQTYSGVSVIMAQGPLSNASLPPIRGLDTYTGKKIHSARWDHDYNFSGKRVAVIGTGASAVQIIPELVKTAAQVKVFQRTPGWVLPRLQYRTPEWNKRLYRQLPVTQRAARKGVFWIHEFMALGLVWPTVMTRAVQGIAKVQLRLQVKDPWMRRQLTPRFTAGCKRLLVTNDYYPALTKENCKLITWPIATLCPNGIRTSDGIEHHVDAIVFATGFDVCKAGTPFPVTGLGGRSLDDEWSSGAYAYKSTSVAGYPNLYLTFGPNSGPGHNSALVYMEAQIEYAVRAIRTLNRWGLKYLDVRDDAQRRFNEQLQQRLAKTTWNSGCRSWYLTEDGFNATMYPGFATQYLNQMSDLHYPDYRAVQKVTT